MLGADAHEPASSEVAHDHNTGTAVDLAMPQCPSTNHGDRIGEVFSAGAPADFRFQTSSTFDIVQQPSALLCFKQIGHDQTRLPEIPTTKPRLSSSISHGSLDSDTRVKNEAQRQGWPEKNLLPTPFSLPYFLIRTPQSARQTYNLPDFSSRISSHPIYTLTPHKNNSSICKHRHK
jgi:hypothetical protein